MPRYAIARFLTADERAYAAAAEYVPTQLPFGEETVMWRTAANAACPLGMAIWGKGNPDPLDVADTLSAYGRGEWRDIARAARAFMLRWDRGQIPPERLAAALGVSA